jgi:putative peptide zinc metalloprotease protein
MRNLTRIFALALTAVVLVLAGPAAARAEGADNVVVVVNTKDGRFLYRVSLKLQRAPGDVVDESNAAVAVASCDGCQTVAVALQALLVLGDPSTVTPDNLAFAFNLECSSCQTLATAYQYVLSIGGPVHLTAAGNRNVAAIRRELHALRHAGLTIVELQAQVDALANRLLDTLATEVVPAGKPG